MAKQKLILLPNWKIFAVVSCEGKIDPKLIPIVELEELSQFGRTAIVEVTIPVGLEVDKEIAEELKKFLTPFGEFLNAKGKSIVVRDTVGNIQRICEAAAPG